MSNIGQSCVAAKRFIFFEELADRFFDKLKTALAAFKLGDPNSEFGLEGLFLTMDVACGKRLASRIDT